MSHGHLATQPSRSAYPQEFDPRDTGTCYRCPKCKQRVTVLVAALVVCCRCGQSMKHCQEPRARS